MKTALFSLTDKTGSADFARFLANRGWRILSTGGTAEHLRSNRIPVIEVSEHTGMPEGMGGRIKTLHPRICGGILGRADNVDDAAYMRTQGIEAIAIVAVNLYDFDERARTSEDLRDLRAREAIDIGGPTLLRSAAKNFENVSAVMDPADYPRIMGEIAHNGVVTTGLNLELATKVFQRMAAYDAAIAAYMSSRLLQ